MKSYFSTFTSGFGNIIKDNLPKTLEHCRITKLLDGLVIYKTDSDISDVAKLRLVNNSYLLIKIFEKKSLDEVLSEVTADEKVVGSIQKELKVLHQTFRVIFSNENQIVSQDEAKTLELEDILSVDTKIDKAKPGVELWFMKRSEGNCYLGIRLTKPKVDEWQLRSGELRPELAHLLCLVSEPSSEDIIIDPFAGYGAIVVERAQYFPYKKVFAGESDLQVFKKLQDRITENRLNITLGRWDATNLTSLTDSSVTKIITDPPWGFYNTEIDDLEEFYKKILSEFSRILKIGGIAVVLMGQKEVFEKALTQVTGLVLKEKLDILISGKKAGVFKIRKD